MELFMAVVAIMACLGVPLPNGFPAAVQAEITGSEIGQHFADAIFGDRFSLPNSGRSFATDSNGSARATAGHRGRSTCP